MIAIANAPVSFGVFELTTGKGDLPAPDDVAGALALQAKLSHESFQTALTEGEGSGVDDVFRRLNTP